MVENSAALEKEPFILRVSDKQYESLLTQFPKCVKDPADAFPGQYTSRDNVIILKGCGRDIVVIPGFCASQSDRVLGAVRAAYN
jgi:hypothetical protein